MEIARLTLMTWVVIVLLVDSSLVCSEELKTSTSTTTLTQGEVVQLNGELARLLMYKTALGQREIEKVYDDLRMVYFSSRNGRNMYGGDAAGTAQPEIDAVDWPTYLAEQDMHWKQLPPKWFEGPFLGNGEQGTLMYKLDKRTLRWDVDCAAAHVRPQLAVRYMPQRMSNRRLSVRVAPFICFKDFNPHDSSVF